jgi:hypothetical protein
MVTDNKPVVRYRLPSVRRPPATPRGLGWLWSCRPSAGQFLSLLSVLPALLVTSWLVPAVPLAALGGFHPLAAYGCAALVALLVVPLGSKVLLRASAVLRMPWWSALLTIVIGIGFAYYAIKTHSEQAILRRDPGAYAQIGYYLAEHGRLTYHIPADAFGGTTGLSYASPGFYQSGDQVVPQFMTGWPTVLAAAKWYGGWPAIFALPAVVGGCAVVAVGGLAARLVGGRWAPVAALLMALAWPVLRTSQTTYSEPLAMLLLAGGMCLLTDVLVRGRSVSVGGHAFAAGLVLAGGELVRVDFGVDFALIIPVLGYLWVKRRRGVVPFVAGAIVGGLLGVLDCTLVTLPYVKQNWTSVRLMLAGLATVSVVTFVAAWYLRRRDTSPRKLRWWPVVPVLGGASVLLVASFFIIRPYVLVDRSTHTHDVIVYTMQMQQKLGLPLDGRRGYVEQSLWWVQWYVGWPILLAALLGAVLLTLRVLQGKDRRWFAVLLVYLGSAVQTLLRPGITPDHPWADRRLVVEVIPAVILFAVWALASASRLARLHVKGAAGQLVPAAGVVAVLAAFVVPSYSSTRPVAGNRTELGEVDAIAQLCNQFTPDMSIVLMDSQWTPMLRDQCGLPAAQMVDPTRAKIDAAVANIRAAGRIPVIGASEPNELYFHNLPAKPVVKLQTRQDQHQLLRRPDGTEPLHIEFYLAMP